MSDPAYLRHQQTEVAMRRADLHGLPPVDLPPGYTLRTSRPGDETAWCAVISSAFPEEPPATVEKWHRQIVAYDGYRPDMVFFIVAPDGIPCATASGMRAAPGQDGYIHWVAVDPAHGGKRLGQLVSLAALHGFVRCGCRGATLVTNTFRLPAVRIYLNLGFVPWLRVPAHRERWDAIAHDLGRNLPQPIVEAAC